MGRLLDEDDVIKAIERTYGSLAYQEDGFTRADAIQIIKSISSAQPEPSQVARDIATILENEQDMRVILRNAEEYPEIIRCKNCKHHEWDEGNEDYVCYELGYFFPPDENFFCGYAERKTDE